MWPARHRMREDRPVALPFPAAARWRAAAIAGLVLIAAPTSSAAFEKAIWGPSSRHGVSLFPVYRQLGVRLYEDSLPWSSVATSRPRHPRDPNDPAYVWPTELSRSILQARRDHIHVMLQIIGAPGWANGRRPYTHAPRRPSDFAAFAAAAARRYPDVHLWMIWGEPSRIGNFQPLATVPPGIALDRAQQRGPHRYARLLDAAYGALKAVSRRNLVIGGNTFTTGAIDTLQWIQNLRLPSGRPPRMDLYGHNPFSLRMPDFANPPSPDGAVDFSDLRRLAGWVDRYLGRKIRLFLSEWTIPTSLDDEFGFWVDPGVQAQWITSGLRLARRYKRIYALGWINLFDDPPRSYGGLIDSTGQRKPGFVAFAHG